MYTGALVRLREYRESDIPLSNAFFNDRETRTLMDSGTGYPHILADTKRWVEKNSAHRDTYCFAIETLDGGRFIGRCDVGRVDWKARVASVGILIGNKRYQGKGYGTDAMEVLCRFCFEQMNLNKVRLDVFSYNTSARRCYEKCGFSVEGVLRQEIYAHGQYHDNIAMGILRGEWDARNRRRGTEEA